MAHSNRKLRSAQRRALRQAKKTSWITFIGTSRNKKLKNKDGGNKKRPPAAKIPTTVPVLRNGAANIELRMMHAGPTCGNRGCRRCLPTQRRAAQIAAIAALPPGNTKARRRK
jgi:hypothetical protein